MFHFVQHHQGWFSVNFENLAIGDLEPYSRGIEFVSNGCLGVWYVFVSCFLSVFHRKRGEAFLIRAVFVG